MKSYGERGHIKNKKLEAIGLGYFRSKLRHLLDAYRQKIWNLISNQAKPKTKQVIKPHQASEQNQVLN